jgi:hypothetical protein
MNPLFLQQQIMQKQVLEHQARLMASRQRAMLGAAWFDDQAQKAAMRRLRVGTPTLRAQAAKRRWPAARLLFWLAAAVVGARLLVSL